ncbi:MAG: metalloregulator ArsR/SmtB family transcription factor [Acidobacteriota bacterium]|nr:metalloregulator ArsR/SmtB family transcription factor [Acidobacteriota bacterium]
METYLSAQLDALGDVTRRTLLEELRHGPVAVGELSRRVPVSRPAVSQHLRVLKEAGLVRDKAVGTRRFYQLDPQGYDALRAYFNSFWTDALEAFKASVEDEET